LADLDSDMRGDRWNAGDEAPDDAPVKREEVVANATAPAIEKYTGVLAAADVFTDSTTFQVLQSIRLDLGHGSWVHP